MPKELRAERENLRAALETFSLTGEVERELELAAALAPLWTIDGPAAEGMDVLAAALARAPDAPGDLRGRALRGISGLGYFCGRYDEALEASEAALDLARRHGDKQILLSSLGSVALDALACDQHARALQLFEEADALALELADPLEVVKTKSNLGYAMLVAGDADGAVPFL